MAEYTSDFRRQVPNLPNLKPGNLLWFLLPALIVFLTFTSFFVVDKDEVGVVLRFGKYVRTAGPGLNFKLPLGMEKETKIQIKRQKKMEFGYGSEGRGKYGQTASYQQTRALEKSMVTGDLNAALVEWVVQYRISDPKAFMFEVRNPEDTLRDASESVMREVVGDRTVDEVITIGRGEIEEQSKIKLRALVEKFGLGLIVDQVQLQNVNPPQEVQASFNEVNEAQQQREEAINIANGEYNKVIPRSRGEAEQKISGAEGYALQRINEAEGDANRFKALFAEYQKAPEVTRQRIYLETMADVMPTLGSKVIMDSGAQQVLPLLNLGGNTALPSSGNR